MSLYNYVDTPNSNLICCICRAPFTDPTTTRTCAHTFCNECILRALSHSAQCPVDRSALSVEDLCPANPIVRSMVDELRVECVYWGEGCRHTCERQGVVQHLRECEYAEVECVVAGCGEVMRRRDVQGHVEGVHGEEEAEEEEEEGQGEEAEKGGEEEGQGVHEGQRVSVLIEQNVMLRHRVEVLEGTVQALRKELSAVKGAVDTLGDTANGLRDNVLGMGVVVDDVRRRGEMALTNETLRLSEEMMSIRAQMHGLRMQMHGMMMDREYSRPSMAGSITKL